MTVVSLFSGAGGFDLGLIQAGHTVLWANDSDIDCCRTYAHNIGRHIVHADITTIASTDIPAADCIIGGFPCQGFSHANLRRDINDDRNVLYREMKRVVSDSRPKYFLAENVPGILSLGEGLVIARIVDDLSCVGYRVGYRLFNVADYGVPQIRRRVIIWGTRSNLPLASDFSPPTPTHSREAGFAAISSRWVTVTEALAQIPEPHDDISLLNHLGSKYKVTNRNFTGHRRTDPSKPSPTILARGNGKGGVCAIQHPLNHRRMTIRESATIQTFPLTFKFFGEMNSCYRQVGNAVPVLFARHLGSALLSAELRGQQLCV